MTGSVRSTDPAEVSTGTFTFLITDIRGYSTFTREHGGDAAARLARRFTDLANDAVDARGGTVIEIRGDEALAVFTSPAQAVRAAVELQQTCAEEVDADPELPLYAGVGIDVGPATLSPNGTYHGDPLNMAARLCSTAGAGEVLTTTRVVEACREAEGVALEARGTFEPKGFEGPVDVMRASVPPSRDLPGAGSQAALPVELDTVTPLVDRVSELRWLRGTWRQARRGRGRVLFVAGPPGIGKTRLAAELASELQRTASGSVRYAGSGGTAAAGIRAALDATASPEPTLAILDDLDAAGPQAAERLVGELAAIAQRPALVVCLVHDPAASRPLAEAVVRADVRGDGLRTLAPLNADGVEGIARLYAGEDVAQVPLESMVRASGGVPARVHEVMSEWARQEATRRLTAAAEYLAMGRSKRNADLEFANNVIGLKLGRLYTVTPSTEAGERCPYKGLASFEGSDAADFFGRERLVGELAARTVEAGLLGVVGDSGSGKSSAVAAGLLPSLRAGLLPGSERWQQVTMRPGEHPMAELLAACRILVPDAGTDALDQALRAVGTQGRLVVFVDQFEEVFTTCRDEDERTSFIEALTNAAGQPERFIAVVALRGDFYGACARYPRFADLLADNHVPVGPMSADEVRRAIELPARRAGLRVETPLVEAMVEELTDEPGGLPLLSTALVELWEQREDGWLRLEGYERSGGLRGAVARLAEATFDQLSDEEREAARRIFLRLVGPGEGDAVTRRRAPLAEFDLERDPLTAQVLERLTADRLVTRSSSSVEVAHEALLREWPRLRGWIDEDAQGHQLRQHLTQAARQWDASGREDSELYRGARLSATMDWAAGHGTELNDLERDFVAQSRQAGDREAQRIRRTNRRLRGSLVGVALFLVVALVAGSVALAQRGQARRSASREREKATIAVSQSLAARAIVEPRLDRAMLLAVQGVKLDDSVQARSGLLSTLLRGPAAIAVYDVGPKPGSILLSPDGRTLLVYGRDTFRFFDVRTRREIQPEVSTPASQGFGLSIDYVDGGAKIQVTSFQGQLMLIDARTHRILSMSKTPDCVGPPTAPDRRTVVRQVDRFLERCDPATQKVVGRVVVNGSRADPVPVAEAGVVVTLVGHAGGTLQIRDGETFAVERSFPLPVPRDGSGCSMTVDRTARFAAISCETGTEIQFVNLTSGAVTSGTAAAPQNFADFTPDAGRFISFSRQSDRNTFVWDPADGAIVQTITGQSGSLMAEILDASGATLYTSSIEGTVYAWDLTGRRGFGRPFSVGTGGMVHPYGGYLYGFVSSSPDGRFLAAAEDRGVVNIVDLTTGRITTSFTVRGERTLASAEFSSDGKEVLVTPGPKSDGKVTLWQVDPGPPRLLRAFPPLSTTWKIDRQTTATFWLSPWAALSPDRSWVAAVDTEADGTSHLYEWNAATGAPRVGPLQFKVNVQIQGMFSAVFSPDGSLIATNAQTDKILIAASSTLKVTKQIPTRGDGVNWLAFSPDGRYLAASMASGTIRLWRTADWRQVGSVLALPQSALSVAFDPTSRLLATTSQIGTTTLWTVPGLQAVGSGLPSRNDTADSLGAGSIFAGSRYVVRAYAGGEANLWPITTGAWEQQACSIAGRNLTHAEWKLFVGGPYERTCPQFPDGGTS